MKLHIITIVLDGEPYIERHLAEFENLNLAWHWHVMEGVALPINDTAWIASQDERLSTDGTHEYLAGLNHPNVTVTSRPLWQGKTEMVNHPFTTGAITEPSVILENDSDECWTAEKLKKMVHIFRERPHIHTMQFKCRYFVGPDIITTKEPFWGGCRGDEWMRAWRYQKNGRFTCHEPPVFCGNIRMMGRHETAAKGLTFDHYAYATEKAVAYKERVYRYRGALDGWRRLQANAQWPARLRDFLPWVTDEQEAVRI